MAGALEQIRILDMSRVLAGPFCTMIMGDLGAEIVKLEAPGGSDDTRRWGPPFQNGISAYYLCTNRNKKNITVDIKSKKGKETIKTMIKDYDVLIHNFKTGTMKRLGLDYDVLKGINPRLVFCSITGFGETGPYKNLPGYDFIIQAMSGLMSITGDQNSGPQKMGVAITDILTGLYACIGIQAALIERDRSGFGQKLDISLYDSAVSALVNIGSNFLMSGEVPELLGNRHANIVPYQTFRTADSEIVIAVGNDNQFKSLCKIIGKPDYADDQRFKKNSDRVIHRETLTKLLKKIIMTKPAAYWLEKFRDAGIPSGPIQTVAEVVQDEQLRERGMFIEMEHPAAGKIQMIGNPIKLSRTPVSYRYHPPLAGEHNKEILDE